MAIKGWTRWRSGGVACVLLTALLLTLLSAENTQPAEEAKTPDLPADLAKVPSDAMLLVSGRVAELWSGEVNKAVRQKYAKQMNKGASEFEDKFGLSPDQVERLSMATMHIAGPAEAGPAEQWFFVGTTKTYNRDNVMGALGARKVEKYKQQTFYVNEKDWSVYPLGERALAYGSTRAIRGLIDRPRKSDGNLAAALRLAAGKHAAVFALNVQTFHDAIGDKLPGETEPFKPLLQAQYGTLTVDLGAESLAEVKLTFASEKDAKAAVQPARTGVDLARAGLGRGVDQLNKQKEMTKFVELLKQVQGSLKATQVEQEGKTLMAAVRLKVDVASVGLVFVEAVQKVREAAARTQVANNLKQIALAMHNYHDTYGRFPPQATYDKNGKALVSWRVMILPFIEENNLYNRFHHDERWDSEHNKKLLAQMPKVYASPQDEQTIQEHVTHYQGFVGKGAFFEGKQGLRITDFTDGTSNTIMIAEASKAVPWTKPEDIPYVPGKPLPKLGLPDAAGFQASLCDGCVRFLSHKITQATLHQAITRNGGEVLGPDFNKP
jgi:hypothetical protein